MLQKQLPTDIFLQPGEHFVGDASLRLRTMLGSCVAITLWQPHRRVGAMSHFLLADRGRRPAGTRLDGRYGDEALTLMLVELAAQGIDSGDCEAKIFGGGDMFPTMHRSDAETVGRRNGEAARRLLGAHGIGVQREHLFGEGHRQVIFDVASGAVWVRQIASRAEPGTRRRTASLRASPA